MSCTVIGSCNNYREPGLFLASLINIFLINLFKSTEYILGIHFGSRVCI